MSVNQTPPGANPADPVPELAPLRSEFNEARAPDHLRAYLAEEMRKKSAAAAPAVSLAHNRVQPNSIFKSYWPASLAACVAATMALGIVLFKSAPPNEPVAERAVDTSDAVAIAEKVQATQSLQSLHANKQIPAPQLSPTGPIYTRVAVPVQTHSLATGPSLRFVNTLTYQNRNGLSRAVFVSHSGAR